jgi:hypothetical protein
MSCGEPVQPCCSLLKPEALRSYKIIYSLDIPYRLAPRDRYAGLNSQSLTPHYCVVLRNHKSRVHTQFEAHLPAVLPRRRVQRSDPRTTNKLPTMVYGLS